MSSLLAALFFALFSTAGLTRARRSGSLGPLVRGTRNALRPSSSAARRLLRRSLASSSSAAGGAPGPKPAAHVDAETHKGSGEDTTANQGVQRNYLGMTAAEDWGQVESARVVHIISTPWDKTNPTAGRKAAATKDHYDNAVEGIYVFNPNTGLRAAAEAEHMTEEQQGAEWLRLWCQMLEKVRDTGGNCYVMAKSTAPGQYTLEGGGQKGEVQVAKGWLDPENTGHKGPSGHWESARIIYVPY